MSVFVPWCTITTVYNKKKTSLGRVYGMLAPKVKCWHLTGATLDLSICLCEKVNTGTLITWYLIWHLPTLLYLILYLPCTLIVYLSCRLSSPYSREMCSCRCLCILSFQISDIEWKHNFPLHKSCLWGKSFTFDSQVMEKTRQHVHRQQQWNTWLLISCQEGGSKSSLSAFSRARFTHFHVSNMCVHLDNSNSRDILQWKRHHLLIFIELSGLLLLICLLVIYSHWFFVSILHLIAKFYCVSYFISQFPATRHIANQFSIVQYF